MGAGVPPGLQNRVRRFRALGGFDSHTFPPMFTLPNLIYGVQIRLSALREP